MSTSYTGRHKKRVKIKYKNVAIALAALLLIIIVICVACSPKDDNSNDNNDPAVSGSGQANPEVTDPAVTSSTDPDSSSINLTDDPTKQSSYIFDFVTMTSDDLGKGDLVLVNNNIRFLGSVSEDDLVVVREMKNQAYWVSDYSVMILPEAMDALNSMMLDFYNLSLIHI